MPPHHDHHHDHHHHDKRHRRHHQPNFCHYDYDELPAGAVEAAKDLQYTKEIWDADQFSTLPYWKKPFAELTVKEKVAMVYLGMPAWNFKCKEIYWGDLDETSKKMATILGYDQDKWDHDWDLDDLPSASWKWADMTPEQREAATYFGFNEVGWEANIDGTNYQRADGAAAPTVASTTSSSTPSKKEEEKKDDDEKTNAAAAASEPAKTSTSGGSNNNKPKIEFKASEMFGNAKSGTAFDHHNHRSIKSITVIAGMIVDGLIVDYGDGSTKREHGGKGGLAQGDVTAKTHKVTLGEDEHITLVWVRADAESFVQAVAFTTNTGKKHGPFGGTGRPIKDKPGQEHVVKAPSGYRLSGFRGHADKTHITALGFRWGPINA